MKSPIQQHEGVIEIRIAIPPPEEAGHPPWAAWTIATLLVCVVTVAFWPSLWNGFNYDDETNIVRNMRYRGLGAEQLRWMFTTFKAGHYQPLSWMSLGLDYLIWGDRPFGYHLTNLILHAANTVLVFWLARILIRVGQSPTPAVRHARDSGWGSLFAAAVAAALFAVHPLRVESVAWVTERRDVLSSFFLLVTVLLYLRAVRVGSSRWWWLGAATFAFALSLLSRAMGVTLPVILLVLDWQPLGRFARTAGDAGAAGKKGSGPLQIGNDRATGGSRNAVARSADGPRVLTPLVEKIPFVILAAAAAVVAPIAQRHVGAAALLEHHGVAARIAQAAYGLVFYLWKTIAPWGLVPMYELHPPLRFFTVKYGFSALAVIAGMTLLVFIGRRHRALIAAGLCYAILLLPVLGLVQSGQQEVADRYSYLPGVVIAILIGGGLARLWRAAGFRLPPRAPSLPAVHRFRWAVGVVASVVVAVLCILTWRQCKVWRDDQTLWSYAVAKGPPCATAHYNLASAFGQEGRTELARDHYIEALRINPRYPEAAYNLGNAFTTLNELDRAEKAYVWALNVNPGHVTACYHLGNALANQGKTDAAILAYREATRLKPDYVEAWVNLGGQLWKKDAPEEAIAAYGEAVRVGPRHFEARFNLGGALAATGQLAEALAELREAVRIDPSHPEARRKLEAVEERIRREPR